MQKKGRKFPALQWKTHGGGIPRCCSKTGHGHKGALALGEERPVVLGDPSGAVLPVMDLLGSAEVYAFFQAKR